MILHLSRLGLRRNVNRKDYNDRENVSATSVARHACDLDSRVRPRQTPRLVHTIISHLVACHFIWANRHTSSDTRDN